MQNQKRNRCYKCHALTLHPFHDNGTPNLPHERLWERGSLFGTPIFHTKETDFQ